METEVILDVGVLAFVGGTLVPLLVGLLTKLAAPSWLKGVLNALLAAVAGGVAVAIAAEGRVELVGWAAAMFTAWVTSLGAYTGWWKPIGTTGTIQRKTARFGI